MANIWEHPNVIASEALRHLEDSLIIGALCAKDKTSEFTSTANGWKVGDTVSFKTHGEYEVTEFQTEIVPQEIRTSSRSMTIEKLLDISVEVTAKEEVLDLDSFSEQVLSPAAYKLAEKVDLHLGTKLLQAHGLYVSGTLYESAADMAQARKAATLQQLGRNRASLIDLDTEATLLGQTWFNQAQTRGQAGLTTLATGDMGVVMGMQWISSIGFPTNLVPHTCGTGTASTNNNNKANNKIGDKVLVCTALSGPVKAGDRVRIAGVRRPLLIAADASATGTSLNLVDPITEVIPNASAITVIGSGLDLTYHGAIMDDKCLGVAFPMLDKPGDKVCGTAHSNGISIRIVKGYDMVKKKNMMSMDLLIGAFMLDPRRVTLAAFGE